MGKEDDILLSDLDGRVVIRTWLLGHYALQWSSHGGYTVTDVDTNKVVLHAIYREEMTEEKARDILEDMDEFLEMLRKRDEVENRR